MLAPRNTATSSSGVKWASSQMRTSDGFLHNAAQILSRSKIARVNESLARRENLKKKRFDVEISDLFASAVQVRREMRQDGNAIEGNCGPRLPRKNLDGKSKNFRRQQDGVEPGSQRR